MNASHPLPPEVGLVHKLRQKHPTCLYSELLDAFDLARGIMPEGTPEELETISSYILEKAYLVREAEANVEA